MTNSSLSDLEPGNLSAHHEDDRSDAAQSSCAKKSSSDVFTFVKENENGSFFCQICQDKRVKQTWATRSTSNFRKHLLGKHPDCYGPKDMSQSRLSHFGFGTGIKRRGDNFTFTSGDKKHADDLLVDWIVNHSQPFSVVEQQDFIEFCHTLRSDYALPTRSTVRARILKRWAHEKAAVRQRLEKDLNGRRCGMTTDMWTSSAKRGYMAVTLHYIDADWEMQSVIIAFVRVMYPHTADRLAQHMLSAVEAMSPRLLPSMWAITADNATTNPAMITQINEGLLSEAILRNDIATLSVEAAVDAVQATDETRFWQPRNVFLLRCLAHVMQLAIKEGLTRSPVIDAAIGHFRDLAKKILDSPKLLEALAGICSVLKINNKVPELDVPTRWNSTWEMMNTILQIKLPLLELIRRIRDRHDGYTSFTITSDDRLAQDVSHITWHAVEDFCAFLKPFKDATVLMSGSQYPTLGLAVPVFFIIQQHVANAVAANSGFTSTHTQRFARKVEEKLNEYQSLVRQPHVTLAAALDPRIKPFLSKIGISATTIKQSLRAEWDDEYADKYCSGILSNTNDSGDIAMTNSFLSFLENEPGHMADVSEPFENEVDRWMAHSPMNMKQSSRDVCQWMKINSSMYPRIAIMARDYLGVTATSVPSESAFSRAGNTVDDQRTRLSDESVQAICELQSFISFNKRA